MKAFNWYVFATLFALGLVLIQSCAEKIDNDQTKNRALLQSECLKLDKVRCLGYAGSPNNSCFYNNISDKCESKQSLRAQDIVATSQELVVLTQDGYLYRQGLRSSLTPEKARSIASAADFCHIDEDNYLKCESRNLPALPAHTKAKHVALSAIYSSMCYIDMKDKVQCRGAAGPAAPDPQFGIAGTYQNLSGADYANEDFSSITVNGQYACGRLKKTQKIVCFGNNNLLSDSDNFLIPIKNTSGEVVLVDRTKYFVDKDGVIRFDENPSALGFGLSFDNFVAQGTKGIRKASSLVNGTLTKNNSVYEIMCFIANNKIYCSLDNPKDNNLINLSAFNPVNPVKITLSNNILCAIDAAGSFQCSNILGESDARIAGVTNN